MPRNAKIEKCLKIFTVSNTDCLTLFKEINLWLDTPSDLSYGTCTLNIPTLIFQKIDEECKNRSEFIKKKLRDFLDLLKKQLGEPERIFPSRSEFVRDALLFHYLEVKLHLERLKNMEDVDPLDAYLKENNVEILREA